MKTPENYKGTCVRVMFSQVTEQGVTASLRHAIGPLLVGEAVVAYEVDTPPLWAYGEIVSWNQENEVAYLRVIPDDIREVPGMTADSDPVEILRAVEKEHYRLSDMGRHRG